MELATIARDINAEHDACLLSAADAVTHAINAGRLLAEVKAGLDHGEFIPWLEQNCRFTRFTAAKYMRVSKCAQLDTFGSGPESISHGLRMLADESSRDDVEPASLPFSDEDEGASTPSSDWYGEVIQKAEERDAEKAAPSPSAAPPVTPKSEPWTKSERERRRLVERGETVVANIKTDKNLIAWAEGVGLYVRIDRQTKFGNPFLLDEDGDRDAVCDAYGVYLKYKPSIQTLYDFLKGKVLGCWCYPERCHGDELIRESGCICSRGE